MKKAPVTAAWVVVAGWCGVAVRGGLPPAWADVEPGRVQADGMTRAFVTPASIPWTSAGPAVTISNEAVLLKPGTRQPATVNRGLCVLRSGAGKTASLLFDFGRELQGGVQIVMGMSPGKDPVRFRVRFGESASETMTDTGETLDGRFLDWPSSENKPAIHAGLQSLMRMTMEAGAELCDTLGEPAAAARCRETAARLAKHVPDPNGSKQAASLLALSGLAPAKEMNEKVLAIDGAKRISTFYGYYVLQAMAAAGNHQGALDVIRAYWGAMLDLGATTFWEDFDLDWVPGSGRIDELTPAGKKDIHGDFGNYCYKGFRHSLCHGWASGPTAWLSEHVLGVRVLEPGCRRIRLEPHLGDLQWAEGSYPTPRGVLTIRHEKGPDGKVSTRFTAPEGVEVIVAPGGT